MSTPEAQAPPSVADALGAASAGTLIGVSTAAPAAQGAKLSAEAQAKVVEGVLKAIDRFMENRRTDIVPVLVAMMESEFPGRPPKTVQSYLRRELEFEAEFARRLRERVERDLKKALAGNPTEYQKLVAEALKKQTRWLKAREDAMAGRVIAAADLEDLKERSAEGALWMLSESVINHTPDCVAMAGKFWPWSVLESFHPPLHYGCPCYLLSLDEAVLFGHMTPDQIPDEKDAQRRAAKIKQLSHELHEQCSDEEIHAWLVVLEAAKRGEREPLRFLKGTEKGGQFKPTRGGYAKPILPKALQVPKVPTASTDEGRHVWIKGTLTWVGEQDALDLTYGDDHFASPPGSTNVYRNGKLVSEPGVAPKHPDVTKPSSALEVEPPAPKHPEAPKEPVEVPTGGKGPILDYLDVELTGGVKAGGSTGAQVMDGPGGSKWLLKTYGGDEDRIATELLANSIYRELGAKVARAGVTRVALPPDFALIPDIDVGEPPLPETKKPTYRPGLKVELLKKEQLDGEVKIATQRGATGLLTALQPPDGYPVVLVARDGSGAVAASVALRKEKGMVVIGAMGDDHATKDEFKQLLRSLAKPPAHEKIGLRIEPEVYKQYQGLFDAAADFERYDPTAPKGAPEQQAVPGQAAFLRPGKVYDLAFKPSSSTPPPPAGTTSPTPPTPKSTWQSEKGFPWDKPKAQPSLPGMAPIQPSLPGTNPPPKTPVPAFGKAWQGPSYAGLGTGVGQRISTGIVVREPDGSMWVYSPKGRFGGYDNTFPKGGLEPGLTAQQNAHKELWEETGLHAQITGFLGDYQGDTSVTRLYLGVRTGGVPTESDESENIRPLTPGEALHALNKERDQDILADVLKHAPPTAEAVAAAKDVFPVSAGTRPGLTYPLLDGKVEKITKPSADLGQHYMADAYVANWDFIGLVDDNVLWDKDGVPFRVDQGGTLTYRARGEKKPFGAVPSEVWTLLGPTGQGSGKVAVTEAQMRTQAQHIATVMTNQKIDQMVDAAPYKDEKMRDEVRAALKGRRDWMAAFAVSGEGIPRPVEGADAVGDFRDAQAKWGGQAQHMAALRHFTNDDSINTFLRGGGSSKTASPQEKATVGLLDQTLQHAHAPDDTVVYEELDEAAFLQGDAPDDLPGEEWTDSGYYWGTVNEPPTAQGDAVMRVVIPAGYQAIAPGVLPGVNDLPEDVVIVRRGARLRITSVEERGGVRYYNAVVLPR